MTANQHVPAPTSTASHQVVRRMSQPSLRDLKKAFRAIRSNSDVSNLVRQFGLIETPDPSGRPMTSETYRGIVDGAAISLVNQWRDTSSVYSVKPDRHEATITLAIGMETRSDVIRFQE